MQDNLEIVAHFLRKGLVAVAETKIDRARAISNLEKLKYWAPAT